MAEELRDFLYRLRGTLEQVAEELTAPGARLAHLGEETAAAVLGAKRRIDEAANEVFERYLDELGPRCRGCRAAKTAGKGAADGARSA